MKTPYSKMLVVRYSTGVSRRPESHRSRDQILVENVSEGPNAPRPMPLKKAFSTGCFSRRISPQPRAYCRMSVNRVREKNCALSLSKTFLASMDFCRPFAGRVVQKGGTELEITKGAKARFSWGFKRQDKSPFLSAINICSKQVIEFVEEWGRQLSAGAPRSAPKLPASLLGADSSQLTLGGE